MRLSWAALTVTILTTAACGSETIKATSTTSGGGAAGPTSSSEIASSTAASTGSTGGAGGGGGFVSAPHAAFPELPDQGGPIFDHVHIVSVNYAGTKFASELDAFGSWLVTSSWFTSSGAEYGIGAGTHEQALLIETPPMTMSTADAVSFIGDHITSGALPPPDAQTLYVLYIPPETLLTDIFGGCDNANAFPSAFHDSASIGGQTFAYAMVPICAQTSLDWTEGGSGHEIIETVTDPLPLTQPAYQFEPGDPWLSVTGEIADLCESLPNAMIGMFSVPRVWSNAAAKKNDAWPCLPAPDGPYFGVTAASPKVMVTAGKSTPVPLSPWSSAPLDPWQVKAFVTPVYLAPKSFTPNATLSSDSAANGDALTLTIDSPASAKKGAQALVVIISLENGLETLWPVIVEVM